MNIRSPQDKTKLLENITVFSETHPDILGKLARAMSEVEVRKGAMIVRKGEAGDAMFIIAGGSVRIHDGNHVLARMQQGEFFGEYSLIDDETRSASVTAEEPCTLLKLDKNDFSDIAIQNPEILRAVLRALIRRMRDMNELEEKLSRSFIKIRRQKEQIEKQNENITRQKELLVQQNFDLTKVNEDKNQLLGMVIHQIKNPLTSSLCMLEMLESDKDKLTEDQDEALMIIINSLWRINNLINETLNVSSIESKVFEVRAESLALDQILKELIENYTYLAHQKEIDIDQQIDKVSANLNRVYFTQIADNLLSNAFKYTPNGKKVTVTLKIRDKRVIFTVEDEGPGISAEMKESLFHQYTRQTDMHTQELPPAGLGLAIVKKYTEAMKGKVICEDCPGGGACFKIELPLDIS